MKGIKRLAVSSAIIASLAACNSSSNSPVLVVNPPPPPVVDASLRVVHAVFDAPNVNILANENVAVESLAYAKSSGRLALAPDTYSVSVDALLPGDNTATVIEPVDLDLMEATNYKVFAVGSAANGTIEPLVVTSDIEDIAEGNIRLQVVHAAYEVPAVDIHVTAPDDELGSALATLDYKDSTSALDVGAGEYRVRITLPGGDTVVFDSGTLDLVSGTDLVVAAINSRFSGDSPVSLLAIAPDGDSFDVIDAGATSSVRVVHNVSDAPAVDVIANDDAKLVENLAFPDFTDYLGVAPDTYNVKVAANADNSVVVIDANLDLIAGAFASVLAVGSLTEETIEPLVLIDQPRRIATEAQVRIVHGSTLAGPVDIYVTATADISDAEPAFAGVEFKKETGYVSLAAGSYVVTVTPADSKTAAIGPVTLDLEANAIYTAIARDGAGLMADVGLILMDDFVPQQ